MPLNPQIIAGIDIPKVRSTADIAEENAVRESANLERQQAAQASRDNMALRQAMARFPTDAKAAADWLGQNGYGHVGVALREQVGKATKSEQDARKSTLDADEKQWQRLNAVSQLITDDASLALARQWVAADDPKLAAFLPETFEDGAKVKTFQQMLISAKDKMDDERARFIHAGTMESQDKTRAVTVRGQDVVAETADQNRVTTERGQTLSAETAAANRAAADARAAASRGVQIRGQDLANARAKEANAGAGGAKLSAGAIEKVAGIDQSFVMIGDINKSLPNMAGNIGPWDGRKAKAKIATGMSVSKELAEFDAQITGLKNAVIKATTGAAMSEPEAKRIMGQIPDMSQSETVFRARLDTTKRNLEMLKRRTIELSGGTYPSQSSAPADTPAPGSGVEVVRGADGKLTVKR